jgi:hypothetical protein
MNHFCLFTVLDGLVFGYDQQLWASTTPEDGSLTSLPDIHNPLHVSVAVIPVQIVLAII